MGVAAFGCGWLLRMVGASVAAMIISGASCSGGRRAKRRGDLEHSKGIRWMPWHQEAMKDVARCEKPWGAASRR